MKQLSFLIKPASGLCNMRCKYCFYEDETANRGQARTGVMTRETTELLIKSAYAAAEPGGAVSFAFQGGEPTLAGLSFFRHFVERAAEYNDRRLRIHYSIQSNGLTVDEEWADFFLRNDFLVGISVDGEQFIHDSLRPDAAGGATYERAAGAFLLLQRKKVPVNLLCVVTRQCAKRGARVYRSLRDLGGTYLQFIPCLDPLGVPRGSMPYSLTPELYGRFLCDVFDEWYRDWKSGRYISVRSFDDYVHLAMGLPAGSCATSGACGAYFVAEGDGSLYPCDFYCLDEWKLGRLGEAPLKEIAAGETGSRFLLESRRRPPECAACRYVRLCFGGCKRDWTRTDQENHNYYCPAFKRFFAYAESRLFEIAAAERRSALPFQ